MSSFSYKVPVLFLMAMVVVVFPLQGQQLSNDKKNEPFIEQGIILTGFSLSFASGAPTSDEDAFINQYKTVDLQIEGLYFLSDHIGIGPLFGYQYFYFEEATYSSRGLIESRSWQYKFGGKAGWYMPIKQIFDVSSRSQIFISGGISWLQSSGTDYEFGYQINTGILFPVGQRIAIETKLGFQARRREIAYRREVRNGPIRWYKKLALGIGFKIVF